VTPDTAHADLRNRRLVFFVNILRDGAGMINREIGLAEELARRGADVTLLSYFRPSLTPRESRLKVDRIWRTGYYGFLCDSLLIRPLALLLVAWKFLRLRPQVVLVDLHQEARLALWLRPLFGYRILFTYHGVADSRFYTGRAARSLDGIRALSHRLLRRVDQVVVVSDFLLAEAERAGVTALRIHNGVDRDRFHPSRCFRNIRTTGPVALFIGRYTEYKGALNVVEAFIQAAEAVPEAELIMHGYFESGEYIDTIRAQIEAAGMEDRIRMLGPISGPEMPYAMTLATVFVNGSVDETFCMPLLEAQACGIPCVAFAAGGIPEVVDDGRSGLLAPPEDVPAYAECLKRILSDPALQEELSAGALCQTEKFTYDRLADALTDAVLPLLNSPGEKSHG
jgi:glycosyltransferase involved in cell wall biosynthesis